MPPAKKIPKAKKKASAPEKPQDALDHAANLISPTLGFVRANFKELFVKFLKVGVTAAVVGLVLVIVFALVTVVPLMLVAGDLQNIPAYLTSNLLALGLLIVWTFIGFFLIGWIQKSISLTAYKITKEQFEGKYSGIVPLFNRIKFPVIGFILLNLAIIVVALGIPALILFLLKESAALLLIGIFLMIIYVFLFMVLYSFFSQFWTWELLIAEKGVVESLKSSINIVKNNIIGVFIFDIIVVVASLVISLPFIFLYVIGEIGFRLGAVVATFDLAAFFGVLSIYIFFRVVISLVQTVITQTVVLPYTYSFWEKIRK